MCVRERERKYRQLAVSTLAMGHPYRDLYGILAGGGGGGGVEKFGDSKRMHATVCKPHPCRGSGGIVPPRKLIAA